MFQGLSQFWPGLKHEPKKICFFRCRNIKGDLGPIPTFLIKWNVDFIC